MRAILDQISKHPALAIAAAIATICSAIFTVSHFAVTGLDGVKDSEGESTSGSTSEISPEPRTSSPETHEPYRVGECLDADNARASCAARHSSEVYDLTRSNDKCASTALLRYLGGVPNSDILGTQVLTSEFRIESGSVCTVAIKDDEKLIGNLRDVLQRRLGDALRKCWNAATAIYTSCSVPHTAEVVAEGPSINSESDCIELTQAYIGRQFDGELAKSTIITVVETEPIQCRISVRGRNVLIHSVRRLGIEAPPIEALP